MPDVVRRKPTTRLEKEVSYAIDRGQRAERHAVMLLGHELSAQRVFKRFLERNSGSAEGKNKRQRADADWQRNDAQRHDGRYKPLTSD